MDAIFDSDDGRAKLRQVLERRCKRAASFLHEITQKIVQCVGYILYIS